MHLTTMAYNLMHVCEEISKIQDPKLVYPSDKKYTQSLEKRQKKAKKKGDFVNPLLFLERIARISSYTIRAFQNAIITGKPLVDLMQALMARLVPG
jgi:hypothetical protein